MAEVSIRPVSGKDRILFLDVLRGLAIFFIFIANTPMFLGSAFYPAELKESFASYPIDYWVDMFVLVFVGGKFYSIFALLFGIGLVVQQRSTARNGIPLSDWMGTGQEMADPLTILAISDFWLFFKLNLISPLIRIGDLLFDGRIFKVLAMFLIGIWAGRNIFEKDLLNNVPFLKKIVLWGFAIGVPANIMRAVIQQGDFGEATGTLLGFLMYAIGVAPLACAYAAGIALWVKSKPSHLSWVAPVGKTALTNYLFQTVISITIYYGVGFGLSGNIGSSVGTLIALCIFAFQVMMSTMWLKKYQYGPVEWLWRKMTYGEA